MVNRFVVFGRLNTVSEALINTRALCLYLLIVAAWRRAVSCAPAAVAENSSIFPRQTPDPYNTYADITGRKFYYHKLQVSNVCDARTDILDTSSWDNDSSWIWEQAFFNDFASGMSLTEYEETTARKTNVGPYTVLYDGWGSMAAQINNAKVIYNHWNDPVTILAITRSW